MGRTITKQNVNTMTAKLCDAVTRTLAGEITPQRAKAVASLGSAAFAGVCAAIRYAEARKEVPDIPFMNAD